MVKAVVGTGATRGRGKITDMLGKEAESIIVRFQGWSECRDIRS